MKHIISLIVVMCFAPLVQAQVNTKYFLLIGTYSSVNSDGIFCYDFDSQTGELNLKSKISGVENPSYLAISRDGKHVYAVNEVKNGTISSFLFNAATGDLSFVNKVSSGGASPCYVSVDDKCRFVFAGNYGSGNLAAVSLNEDGSLGAEPQYIKHEG